MATAAQLTANRDNAQRSTGPRSEQGKAHSSQNNLRHGFRSQSVLLPGDDPAEYQDLLDELTAHFDVNDLTSERYVREMADAEWRLRRVRAHQESILCAKIAELASIHPALDPTALQALAFETLHRETSFALFLRYESQFERQYERAYQGWIQTREKVSRYKAREIRSQLNSILAGPILPDEPNSHPVPTPSHTPSVRPEPEIEANQDTPRPQPVECAQPEPIAIPRSAPCPCGSGQKYKRCCGRTAPAVLNTAMKAA